MQLEPMSAFFDARVDGYEEHMYTNVDGAAEYYALTADLIPTGRHVDLLDLGCGTGLELDEIAKRNRDIRVVGIDLSNGMLSALRAKHGGTFAALELNQASYFDWDYPECAFDVALSVQTMHHFPAAQKIALYSKICAALRPGGCYIETDYVAKDQAFEAFHFAENARLRAAQGIADGEFYHYDTPCTIENQLKMFSSAGFARAEVLWQHKGTAIMRAWK